MKRKINILFFIVFMSMLLIPAVLTDTERKGSYDNTIPSAGLAVGKSSFHDDIEVLLKDGLGLRDRIDCAYASVNDALFCELIDPVYQYGKDRYTFFKIHSNIEYSDYHKRFAEMVSAMQEYCESRGSHFYYVFNPEKESIYRDQLPAGVNYDDSWVDKMLSDMEAMGVKCIDLRNVLETKNEGKAAFNRKTDAGHWNHNGAFYGMQEITNYLHRDMPDVEVLGENEYDIYIKDDNNIYGSESPLDEKIPVFIPKSGYTDITGAMKKELAINRAHPYFQLVQNDSDNAKAIKRLLLFEDDLYIQFAFARSEKTVLLSCLQNAVNFDYYYNIFKPDVVIFENMEYVVNNNFFNRTLMEEADYNPAILENYPEESFQERRDQLLWQTEEVYADTKAVLIPGTDVDQVFISNGVNNTLYAYLITDEKVIDLKRNKSGALTTSVRHGDLTEGSYVVLYLLNEKGEGRYARIPVSGKRRNAAYRKSSSGNTTFDRDSRKYTMTGYVENDPFKYTALLLYNENATEQIDTIKMTTAKGLVYGGYCHNLPTGDYTLFLRAGRRITTEKQVFKVHLVEGKTYYYRYNVDKLSNMEVVISGFEFSKN